MNELTAFYSNFDFADNYSGYIRKFTALLQEESLTDWNMSGSIVAQESETQFYVQLTPDQVKDYASASFQVLMKYEDSRANDHFGDKTYDGYYILFQSADVILDQNGKLLANYEGKTQMAVDPATGESILIQMLEQEVTDTYVRYYVPIILGGGDEKYTSGFAGADIQLQADKDGSNVKFLSVIPTGSVNHPYVASKQTIDIYEYRWLTFTIPCRKPTYKADGSLVPFDDWENPKGLGMGFEIELNQETKDSLIFVQEELDDTFENFMVINIKDVYGKVASSNMIPITK